MYIERVRNQHAVPCVLLRESFRAEGKVRKRTIANLNADGEPVQSFQDLLKMLRGIAKNRIQPKLKGAKSFDKVTIPSSLQQRALDLLGVTP